MEHPNMLHMLPTVVTKSEMRSVERGAEENVALQQLGRATFAINRVFADLRPLLFRTRVLALNAEIVSARIGRSGESFGVVVRDLVQMGRELMGIVTETETLFQKAATHVAWWLRMKQKFDLYLRSLARHRVLFPKGTDEASEKEMRESSRSLPLSASSILYRQGILQWAEEDRGADGKNLFLHRLWEQALEAREQAVFRIGELRIIAGKLERLLDRMAFVATRQSHFLATSSMIEACRAGEAASLLQPVAQNIRELADGFMAIQGKATQRVRELAAMANRVWRQIKKGETT